MLAYIKRMFRAPTVAEVNRHQLAEAETLAVIHAADAEHHAALAAMYERRARRVRSVIDGGPANIPWPPLPSQR